LLKRGSILCLICWLQFSSLLAQLNTDSSMAMLYDTMLSPQAQIIQIEQSAKALQSKSPKIALQLLDKGIVLSTTPLDKNSLAYFYYLKARIQVKLGEKEEALLAFDAAKTNYLAIEKYVGVANVLNDLGWMKIKEGQYQLARNQFEAALDYAEKGASPKKIADNYNDIGASYHYQKNYEQATTYYLKAVKIREAEQLLSGLAISYNNLGLLYKLNKDTLHAFQYYRKGLLLTQQLPDSARMVSFNINIGRLYLKEQHIKKAIPFLEQALKIAQAINHKSKIAISEYNLAEAYQFDENYTQAIPLFKKCIKSFEQLGESSNKIETIFELGKTYSLASKHEKGLQLMLQAQEAAKKMDIVLVEELQQIAKTYKNLGQPQLAYQYLNNYITVKDSIESQSMQEHISELQTKYEASFQAKEKEKEIALLKQEKSFFNKLLLFAAFFSLFIITLAALLFRNNRKKQRLNVLLNKQYTAIKHQQEKLLVLNEQLVIAEKEARQGAKAKEEFLASMSHEIRTPMNAVIGMTNILIDEAPRTDQIENLKILKFSANNLLTLINDILDFSKIEAGHVQLEQIDFSVEKLLKNILETFAMSKKKIGVELLLQGDYKKIKHHLRGDPTRLTQIFTNLLGNAVKFTQQGHVALIAKVLQETDGQVYLYFAVEDTGIGIPKDKMSIIFESFTQASDTTTRLYGGTGLGLAITKSLVGLHNSVIELDSTVGKGSTFAFRVAFPKGAPLLQETIAPIENSLSIKIGLEGRSILLAEDNKINQLVAKKILSKWKVNVDIANDGLEVLDLLKIKDYDLILMDIQMPNLNGYDTTKAIRKLDGPKSTIPIIALTASAYSMVAIDLANYGMDDYVSKPFNPNDLHTRIAKLINARLLAAASV